MAERWMSDASGGQPQPELVDRLRQRVAELSDGKLAAPEIDPDGHLFDCGYVDSLSAVLFLARIEEEFEVRIEDTELLGELSSLRSIADRIAGGR
jgi:acyl carrier protein